MVAPRRHVSGWGCAGVCSGGKPDCGLAPIMGGRTGRRHRDLDTADADAHERTELEQLEATGATGGVREFGVVEYGAWRTAGHKPSSRTTAAIGSPASWRSKCD